MKIFPSQYFFDRETEGKYVEWVFAKTQYFVIATVCVVSIFLVATTVADIYTAGFDVVVSNVFAVRAGILVVSIFSLAVFFGISSRKRQFCLFLSTILIAIMASLDTYLWVGEVGRFSEGAQVMTVMVFMIVPLINVEHKMVGGFVIILGIYLCHLLLKIEVFWTLFYTIIIYFINIAVYYKFDLLLRIQFKAICKERHNANIDQLTGVYNRKALQDYFTADIASLTSGQEIIVGILDIDCFKLYNDTYGHLEGDRILKRIGTALQSCGFDRVYRFGGEEFIFTCIHRTGDSFVMPDVCALVKDLKIPHDKSSVADYLTASVGVTTLESNKVNFFSLRKVSPDNLIKAADDNLYSAKDEGRNRMIRSRYKI